MRLISRPWVLAALLTVACGNSFSAGGGNGAGDAAANAADASMDSTAGDDGSPPDAGGDVASAVDASESSVPECAGGAACSGTTPVCCLPMSGSASCAHEQCGCDTQLACASDKDCMLPTALCCIGNEKDSVCSQGHFVAACATTCPGGSSHLCQPGAALQCAAGKQCSTNSGDLQNVGLPPTPYGVCQ
jgi:hypothetical protein